MSRGLTLIETLAVVTLLTLVVSLVTASFSGTVDAARLREAMSIVRDVDAHARLRARVSGPIMLVLNANRSAMLLREIDGAGEMAGGLAGRTAGRASSPVRLPEHMRVFLLSADGNEPLESVQFDRRGVSRDYRFHIEFNDQSRSLHVAGLTGWIEEDES